MQTNLFDCTRTLIYLGVAFGWSWTIALIIWLNGGLQNPEAFIPGISNTVLMLVLYMLGPALGHIVTRLVTGEGWQDTRLRPRFRQGWKYWLLVWLVTPLLIGVGALVFFLLFPQHFDPTFSALSGLLAQQGLSVEDVGMPLGVMLAVQVIQAVVIAPVINAIPILGEEFGWRAYLQPKLMPLGRRRALLYSNIIWGLWHAPVIAMGYNYGNYNPNYWGAPWSGILMMTLAMVWIGTFFGWATYKAKSVWPAVIGHGSLNGIAPVVFLITQGEPLLLLGPSTVGLIGGFGFAVAGLVILFTPGLLEDNTTG